MSKTNWANVLTWSRLILILPISIAALLDTKIVVLIIYCIAQLTDFFDGKIARYMKVDSEKGAVLDSRVDTILGFFLAWWLWLLFPQLFSEYWKWIVGILTLTIISLLVARAKLGKIVGLHLWSAKLMAVVLALLLPALIVFGVVVWFVWSAIIICIISLLEEIIYMLKGGKNLDAKYFWDD